MALSASDDEPQISSRALGDAAVHLAGAERPCAQHRPWPAAMDMARLDRPTLMLLAMQPTTLPQPTIPAIVSSFMQFCNETT